MTIKVGNGSIHFPTLEELEDKRREIFDRWCWETGSKEDWNEIEQLDIEIERLKRTPAYTFSSDTNTGFYRKGNGDLGFVVGGTEIRDKK